MAAEHLIASFFERPSARPHRLGSPIKQHLGVLLAAAERPVESDRCPELFLCCILLGQSNLWSHLQSLGSCESFEISTCYIKATVVPSALMTFHRLPLSFVKHILLQNTSGCSFSRAEKTGSGHIFRVHAFKPFLWTEDVLGIKHHLVTAVT